MLISAEDWRKSVAGIMEVGRILAQKRKEMSITDFDVYIRSEYMLNRSSAQKLIRIARDPILSNPANADKLLPQWIKLYELSLMPPEAVQKAIEDGSAKTLTKYQIWAERDKYGKRERKPPIITAKDENGTETLYPRVTPIKIPEGSNLLDLVKAGIEHEKDGLSSELAAKKVKLGLSSYRRIKYGILLSGRHDLSEEDKNTVTWFLYEVNRTNNVSIPYLKLSPIVDKVWGGSVHGRHITVDSKSEAKRKEPFKRALVVICDTCNTAADLEVPYLSQEETASAISRLIEAKASLHRLAKRIRGARR